MSDVAAWKAMADSMFAGFGDVVFAVSVAMEGGSPTYDASKGAVLTTETTVTSVGFWTKNKHKLPNGATYSKEQRTLSVRGSDFASSPSPEFAVTVGATSYMINNVFDPSGIGAYFDLVVTRQ